ncbi:MAG: hypothetical protein KatS3mg044_1204 [Rhodothermaceae bacterium]|nr:MAG: hypothetical protein KatS3mg044_1204 [Rhodothermaceae bacterium]
MWPASLCRTPEELARTDIADYALEALRESRVREIFMLGRRGPAQAAFTLPEARELGELPGADVFVPPEEAALDPFSQALLAEEGDRDTLKKVELIPGIRAAPSHRQTAPPHDPLPRLPRRDSR